MIRTGTEESHRIGVGSGPSAGAGLALPEAFRSELCFVETCARVLFPKGPNGGSARTRNGINISFKQLLRTGVQLIISKVT